MFSGSSLQASCETWDQESQDYHKKSLVLFKHPSSKAFVKETQQTPSINQARKAEAIFNTVLCVMQFFPHAGRETQSTKDACVSAAGVHLLQGTEIRLEQLKVSLME